MRGVQYEAREVLKFGRASHIQIWFWNGDRHRRLYWRTNGHEATVTSAFFPELFWS
jgi:hypothetical protein